ncbi:MAG: 2-C-methyl-D-erythritol 2,4-cyclodiphosphate synthase [Bacteroidales bacterium]|nr:2-C-methyl-D-erythritol 2,4-cyclodiphosphate synthase [Bacteroidales bacterium]
MGSPFRVGMGYDVHPLVPGRPMILGGVAIPSSFGPDGHSDADVLIHALADAILGSVALGDIGQYFPPSDNKYKNLDSRIILRKALDLLYEKGYVVGNVDSVVALQSPKLAPYIPEMKKVLADLLQVTPDDVSVKATTTEKLGFVGRGEGISAYATVLVFRKQQS